MYFKAISNKIANILLLINVLPLIFKNHPANIHKINALNGIRMLDVMKSRKSKIVFLQIVKFSNNPNDKQAGTEIKPIIMNNIVQAFLRDTLNLSDIEAVGTSKILIPDVIAAARSKIKNNAETISPCGI